ncbi:hypothetical protein BJ138DRAFT_1118836 [Hygrophoropsis aurantiaca]|uniref:Uncharacterized protein n=1 Tax=Hygrophoropsis aurantiaca TaxID=72124 RepID=A0ACB7ZV10_9AGAM|nr:hypothetical protein BJ138DRAFT_1118836 [Hygrophoropsis aurantiaca]
MDPKVPAIGHRKSVGKSSLIHRAFGITGVKIEDDKRGEANIDTEFTSSENARFVLHDSQGFESGEEDRVKIVKDFIARRRDMPQLKDRVHAIWLCLAAPHAQGRVFETGVEDFFKNKQEILGDIPIITVFTKLDLLDNAIEMETVETEAVEAEQRRAIEERCIKPLKDAGGDNLSHAVVSTKKDYEYTIIDLLQTTVNNVEKYVTTKGASLTGKIAQRANIDLKIDASIDVGKKKYWRNLAASADFKGHTLLDCFFVIHTDIVAVWNFQDPKNYLIGEELRKSMVEMVSDLATPPSVDPNKTLKFGLSAVASIAGILGSVAGPAMTVVVPVLAVAVIAAWAYAVYQQSHEVIKRLMLYIVNLTLVMEMLFLLAPEQVSMDDIKKAIQIYENAPAGKHQTRCKILNYDHSAITTAGRDHALQFIEKLIKEASIDAGEAPDLQKKIAETIHH